jgi:hypothetical protein
MAGHFSVSIRRLLYSKQSLYSRKYVCTSLVLYYIGNLRTCDRREQPDRPKKQLGLQGIRFRVVADSTDSKPNDKNLKGIYHCKMSHDDAESLAACTYTIMVCSE